MLDILWTTLLPIFSNLLEGFQFLGQNLLISLFTNSPTVIFRKVEKNN